ncbi:uncharacterized protein BX664DRAFT_325392 [Halteromyces radiatus]|uniref:uncharacterized protein n=1 Tax=Halteromyces radiatus TaxID=101107 RepID=UPI002220E010|nr:uncharacterized protein BX664DRAFT_325392 [Halteromyces radiatus]KAI8097010.1 hypothetical protein BX664DRAFT_325392 [Halteromyces radiatus]
MLHEEDDPLSSSIFGSTLQSSFMDGRSMQTPVFSSSHYDDVNDPWGNTSAFDSSHNEIGRSFTTPNIQALSSTTTGGSRTNGHMESNSFNNGTPTAAMVLSGVRLPESYNTLFAGTQRSGRVSLTSLHKILERANLSARDVEKIIQLVVPNGTSYVTRPEFTTALALIYCAQNNFELSLNSLYQQRQALGTPVLTTFTKDKVPNPLNGSIAVVPSPLTTAEESIGSIPKTTNGLTVSPTSTIQHDIPQQKLNTKNWFKNIEEIKLTIAPEREGFIFKHVNYIVTSQKRSSIVLRRFSDFWWLMEILARRYPYRMLPNLPPKKLGGRDAAFLEKRRKGLSRFINAVVRHPTLRTDSVVTKFLTEPSELAAWRKQYSPSVDDEYKRKQHDIEDMKSMIPNDLADRIQKTRTSVGSSIDHYVNLCFIMERTIRRMHGQATDYVRYSIALNSLAESELRYHASECRSCRSIVHGYEKVAKHMQKESSILDNQVSISADGILENLKQVRDLLVSFRELVDRKEKLTVDNSDILMKRINSTKAKINQNRGVPGMETEVERLLQQLQSDEHELRDQKWRQTFIDYCIWSEMTFLHKQQAFVSTLYRNYVKEMVEFSRLRAENWQQLEEPVFEMPVDWDLFT